jgi:hypothetical protein
MKRLPMLLTLIGLAASVDQASTLVTFDDPNQTGQPGATLMFSGVLSNGGPDTVFLNSDTLNLVGNSFTVTDLFFSNVPVSLDPGQSSADIQLFAAMLLNPFSDLPGDYIGTYTLLGGEDSNAQDVVGSGTFSVTANTVPEPSSSLELGICLALLIGLRWRRKRLVFTEKRTDDAVKTSLLHAA